MNLDGIPKTFWHSLSLSVLILTGGFVYVSVKSGNLVVKYADLEFKTSSAETAIADAEVALRVAKKESEEKAEQLRREKAEIEEALADARRQIDAFVAAQSAGGTRTTPDDIAKLKEQLVLQKPLVQEEIPSPAYGATETKPSVAVKSTQQLDQVQLKINQLGKIREQLKQRQ